MKSLFNNSIFSYPSSLTRVSTSLILLAMLAMSGNVWGQTATWTRGTTKGTDVWYMCKTSDNWDDVHTSLNGNSHSMVDDPYWYSGKGIGLANLETNEIAKLNTTSKTDYYRTCVEELKLTLSAPKYSKVTYSLDLRTTTYASDGSAPKHACELFYWGTTANQTISQSYTTKENSATTKTQSVCKAYSEKNGTKESAWVSKSFSLDNADNTETVSATHYFAVLGFIRRYGALGTNKNYIGIVQYQNANLQTTYYTTVTFDGNGATEGSMAQQSIENSAALTQNAYTRPNHAFVGWNTAADGSGTPYADQAAFEAYNESTRGGKGPVTLYAQWKPSYTVTFDPNGGSVTPTVTTVAYGAQYGQGTGGWPTPTLPGYTFAGWYTDASGGTKIESNTIVNITQNQTLYAHWTLGTFTVSFDAAGGSVSPTSSIVTYTKMYREGTGGWPIPTRDGYSFEGWCTSEGTKIEGATIVTITANQTLYAHWTSSTSTIKFVPATNGGQDCWKWQWSSDADTWQVENGDNTSNYNIKQTIAVDGTQTGEKQIASFKTDNNTGNRVAALQEIQYQITIPSYTKVSCSYNFKVLRNRSTAATSVWGANELWYFNTEHLSVGTGDQGYRVYTNASSATSQDKTIIRVASNDSGEKTATTTTPVSMSFDNSTGAAEKPETRYFYAFSYWRTGGSTANKTASTYYKDANITYTYYNQIQYNLDGGTGVENSAFATSNSVTNTIPTKTGYTFAGWKDANTQSISAGTIYTATSAAKGPITLTAVWAPAYHVSFHANGGGGTMSNKTNIAMDEEFEIPANGFTAPTFTVSFNNVGGEAIEAIDQPMTFNGWEDHGDIVGSDGNTYAYTEYDGAYYANKNVDVLEILGGWKYDKYAILSHYINSGKTEGRKPLNPDGVRGTYLAGERSWTDGNGVVHQSNVNMLKRLTTTPGYTVPLYAQWAGTITLPTPASRTAYEFLGWYDGETRVGGAGDDYTPTQNVTLTSKWKESSYYISFDANGGTGSMETQTVNSFSENFITPENSFGAPTYTLSFENEEGEPVESVSRLMTFNGWEDHGEIYLEKYNETYTFEDFDAPFYANTYGDLMAAFGYNKSALINHYATYTIHGAETRIAKGYPAGTYPAGATVSNLTNTANYTVPLYAQWAATITLPTPTRSGNYLFDGWYDGETRVGGAGSTYIMTTNTTLEAKWVKYYYETSAGAWSELEKWTLRTDDGSVRYSATALPTSSSPIVVRTALTINSEVACYSLTIEDGGSVTIAPTGGLSVGAGGVTGATTSNFRIQSSTTNQGYFRMSPEATTAMPVANVEYATKGTLDTGADKDATWQYFGVPCSANMTVDHTMWLNQWDVNSGWVKKAQGLDHTLQPWTGYSITQYGRPTYSFSGTLLNGNQTINLTGTAATQGMNLIANSYSAPIDVTKFEAGDFTGDAIYTFYIYNAGSWNEWENNKGVTPSQSNHAPGTYTAIPAFSASLLEGEQTLIAPMQAIMIQLTEASATVRFNYAKHVWGAAANHGSSMTDPIRAPHRATANPADELTARVRLSVGSANSGVDHLYMLERPDFTGDYDNGYDAPKMATRGLVNLYTTVTEGMLAVDAKDQLENTYVGFAAGSDSEYSLHFSAVLGTEYYLLDQQTGICTQMAEGAHYDFSATPNSINDYRFIVLRQRPGISTALPNVSDSESQVTEIYTISGLRMDLPLSELPKGIYIIRQGQTVNKIAIQ